MSTIKSIGLSKEFRSAINIARKLDSNPAVRTVLGIDSSVSQQLRDAGTATLNNTSTSVIEKAVIFRPAMW